MLSRRVVLSLLASASAVAASGTAALAKKKNQQNGHALLGGKIKQNGKHKFHKAGKVDVSADVQNGKVVGITATDTSKGTNLPVRKVKSRQKLAEAPSADRDLLQLAQTTVEYYYGYWFYDGVDDWYYWFPADVVIVDETWVEYSV